MASFNRALLIGNVGGEPEIRYTAAGKAVANFSLATSEKVLNKETGERVEKTEWHNIVLWDKQAETAAEYVKKGSLLHIEGRLQTRKWTDKAGVERSITEIVAERFQLLDKKSTSSTPVYPDGE